MSASGSHIGMNIAMVISVPFPPREGVGFYTKNLSATLVNRGHEVTVITRGSINHTRFEYDGLSVVKTRYIPLYPFHVDIHGLSVNRFIASIEDQLDLVHLHTPLPPVVKASAPIVTTCHSSFIRHLADVDSIHLPVLLEKLTAKITSERILRKQLAASSAVTTVSESVRRELDAEYGPSDITVLGNGVDHTQFQPEYRSVQDRYLLFVGRLTRRKGVMELLEAYNSIADDFDVGLKIAGDGPLRTQIHRFAEENGLTDRIDVLGHLDREPLIELYQGADLFVFPSHSEGLPTVVLEAMACGLPVVTTNIDGCRDIIESGRNGVLVPPKRAPDLGVQLRRLLRDETNRRRLGAAARHTVEDNYTWEVIGDAVEGLYRDITA